MFVTYLVTYTGDKLPPLYIGSTSEKRALSGKYFGSVRSKKWQEIFELELSTHIELFSLEIISYHETRDQALFEELRLQELCDVVRSDQFFNMSYAKKNGSYGRELKGIENPSFGSKRTEESKSKMSASKKGKTYEEIYGVELAAKMREDRRKVWQTKNPSSINGSPGKGRFGELHPMFGKTHTDESKKLISEAASRTHKGRTLSEEHKLKISETLKNKKYE